MFEFRVARLNDRVFKNGRAQLNAELPEVMRPIQAARKLIIELILWNQ